MVCAVCSAPSLSTPAQSEPPPPSDSANQLPWDTWAVETNDIPNLTSLVRRKDVRGSRWVVLHGYYDWRDNVEINVGERAKYQHRMWSLVMSWLVSTADRDKLFECLKQRTLWGRWMPEDRKHIDTAYLGELPWGAASNEYLDSWRPINQRSDPGSGDIRVYPAWDSYTWEGNILDCSINDSVVACFPAPILFETGGLKWQPGTRRWCGPDGAVVAQFLESDNSSSLLVREDWLTNALEEVGVSIVLGRLGEKKLTQIEPEHRVVGDWTEVGDVASLEDSYWTFGEPTYKRRAVPIQ